MYPPLLIISGLGAPRLSAQGYGLTFRNRGHRVYTTPQRLLGLGDVRVMSAIVATTAADVLGRTAAERLNVIGMSLGGLIGLYWLKCGGGGPCVDTFVSVGGPLNGSTVARLVEQVPVGPVHAIAQTCPDSDLMRELRAATMPAGVRAYSVGTRGDVLTPRSSWDHPGLEPIETPYGCAPVGHWSLFFHPGNHRIVAELIEQGRG